jgi:actin related protein 2/3 complex subunit 1A/1B
LQHDLVVADIDWSPVTHKIVSCSHDRNAFVWTYNEQTQDWKPELVILRINRAALSVKWDFAGQKFAVASGAKCVPICHYEASNDWWISKMAKKHKSTVLALDWHPSNQLLATGCCDFKCRVISAFVTGLDENVSNGLFEQAAFGDVLFESDSSHGWVEAVAWAPTGQVLAYATHDATITCVTFAGIGQPPFAQNIKMSNLPMSTLCFLADDTMVAAGHDMKPALYTADAQRLWAFNQWLDRKEDAEAKTEKRDSGFGAARAMFESKVSRGGGGGSGGGAGASKELWTRHENTIMDITHLGNGVLSSSSVDGRLVIWRMQELVK